MPKMLGTMIEVSMVFLLLLLFYLRIRRIPIPDPVSPTMSLPSRRSLFHFVFPPHHDTTTTTTIKHGLDPTLIHHLLPATVFRTDDFKHGLDCAVCLTEVSEGEEVRLLPQCGHGFHSDCIDMWLHSSNSCPLCRAPVCEDSADPHIGIPVEEEEERELSSLPAASVLLWGSMDTINTRVIMSERPERMLVIDVPNRESTSGDGLHSLDQVS